MPTTFAARLSVVAPSATLAVNARAAELRSRGIDVVAFGVGEPDFEPPAFVLQAAKDAIDAGCSKYTAVTGIAPLKKAIADDCLRRRGHRPNESQITVSVGAKHVLCNLAIALYEPGDEVIIPKPAWVSYPEQVRMMGGTPVLVDTRAEDGFRLTAEQLKGALSPKTKAIVICSPSNPTGTGYTRDEWLQLLEVVRSSDCWLIVDEIYASLVYDGFVAESPYTLAPDLRDRIVVVDGVSKSHAMTGWRIGWSISPQPLASALDVVQGQSTTNATAVAQHAAVAALNGPREALEEMRKTFEGRRNLLCDGLAAIPGIACRRPEGAFYAFADVRGLLGKSYTTDGGDVLLADDDAVVKYLLDVAHVAVVPGSAFYAPGFVRFSYATSDARIREGLTRIERAVAALH